jgi:alcohol dehydrogenase
LKPGQRVATNPYLVAHENMREPAQILTGLTGISPDAGQMLQDFGDGTLAEYALQAASTLTPLDGLEAIPSEKLATLGKFVIPLGGLLRGRLAVGETLVVHGATGYFGSAAVLLGIALGAAKVVMVGRNKAALDALTEAAGPRAVAVAATGNAEEDAKAIRAAAGGGADLAFDMVGQATSSDGTLATLRALRRGGRLVLMGSMVPDLPISYREMLLNNWEIIGNFMYPAGAYQKLVQLIAMGALSLDKVSIQRFELADLDEAMTAAARMKGLDCTIVTMGGR